MRIRAKLDTGGFDASDEVINRKIRPGLTRVLDQVLEEARSRNVALGLHDDAQVLSNDGMC